jgi:hypothetical protein
VPLVGTPLAYQALIDVFPRPCESDEIMILTEVLNGGSTSPSNQIPFSITAN